MAFTHAYGSDCFQEIGYLGQIDSLFGASATIRSWSTIRSVLRILKTMRETAAPKNIDDYVALFPPRVQPILEKIRAVIRQAAPDAEETISYRMPAFKLNGIVVYFAAFKKHIGLYPPVRGDAKLEKSAARYAGEKGNLKFPLDEPIPYDLIKRIVKFRVKQNMSKARASGARSG